MSTSSITERHVTPSTERPDTGLPTLLQSLFIATPNQLNRLLTRLDLFLALQRGLMDGLFWADPLLGAYLTLLWTMVCVAPRTVMFLPHILMLSYMAASAWALRRAAARPTRPPRPRGRPRPRRRTSPAAPPQTDRAPMDTRRRRAGRDEGPIVSALAVATQLERHLTALVDAMERVLAFLERLDYRQPDDTHAILVALVGTLPVLAVVYCYVPFRALFLGLGYGVVVVNSGAWAWVAARPGLVKRWWRARRVRRLVAQDVVAPMLLQRSRSMYGDGKRKGLGQSLAITARPIGFTRFIETTHSSNTMKGPSGATQTPGTKCTAVSDTIRSRHCSRSGSLTKHLAEKEGWQLLKESPEDPRTGCRSALFYDTRTNTTVLVLHVYEYERWWPLSGWTHDLFEQDDVARWPEACLAATACLTAAWRPVDDTWLQGHFAFWPPVPRRPRCTDVLRGPLDAHVVPDAWSYCPDLPSYSPPTSETQFDRRPSSMSPSFVRRRGHVRRYEFDPGVATEDDIDLLKTALRHDPGYLEDPEKKGG